MIVLLHKSVGHVARFKERKVGRLISPRGGHAARETHALGIPWAADNDCFQGLDEAAYRRMLAAIGGVPGCLFCAVPDVVGDAAATAELFDEWAPVVRQHELPVALVAQDGLTLERVPWDRLDAIFVGGTTGWKYDAELVLVCREALRRGKWVHYGRVNTLRRATWARAVGAQSFDGTNFSRFTDTKLPRMLDHLDAPTQEALL